MAINDVYTVGIMAIWTISAVVATIFMTLYKSEDYSIRLNMKISPSFEYRLTIVGVMVVNCLFCYIWEVNAKVLNTSIAIIATRQTHSFILRASFATE